MGIAKNKITKIFIVITFNWIVLLSVYHPVASLDNNILTESNEVDSLIEMNYFNNDYIDTISEHTFSIINFFDENDNMIFSNDDETTLSELNFLLKNIQRNNFDELPEFEISHKAWWAESFLLWDSLNEESNLWNTLFIYLYVRNIAGDYPMGDLISVNATVEIDSFPYHLCLGGFSTNYWPNNSTYGIGMRISFNPEWFPEFQKPNFSTLYVNINCSLEGFTQNQLNDTVNCTYDIRIFGNVTSIDNTGVISPVDEARIYCIGDGFPFFWREKSIPTGEYMHSVHPLDEPHSLILDGRKDGYETQTIYTEPVYEENDTINVDMYLERLNERPYTPEISGQINGTSGDCYYYTFTSGDPNNDYLYYFIDWGDDEIEEWIGPYAPEDDVIKSHTWDDTGKYTILCKTKDVFGAESDWGILKVTMPFNNLYNFPILSRILDLFPNAFPIIRQLIGLIEY